MCEYICVFGIKSTAFTVSIVKYNDNAPLREGDDVAEGVCNDLDLDVVRILNEALNQHAVISEGAAGLGLAQIEALAALKYVQHKKCEGRKQPHGADSVRTSRSL